MNINPSSMTINSGVPTGMNMNSNAMIENFKSMAITMLMFKGTNGSSNDNNNSFINTIIMMFVISFIDSIAAQLKFIFGALSSKLNSYLFKQTNNISIIKTLSNSILKVKKSSIIVKIESATSNRNPTSDAVIDLLTHFPHTKCILLQNGTYNVNYDEEIEINKNLFAKLVNNNRFLPDVVYNNSNSDVNKSTNISKKEMKPEYSAISSSSAVTAENGYEYIELYSYSYDMEVLRKELNDIVSNYLIKMNNKLGNNIYYFTELPVTTYKDINGNIDRSKLPETIHFRMKQFTTNRSFKNLFGSDINLIRKRTEFFRDNKDWYDTKGVPYTLGVMVSGNPGSGKTSVIKCIANELKRHIINIHLSDNMTKTQLENLFYNEQLHITQNGRTETYTIPINKRLYVLEDVDCQCDVILDRGEHTVEQKLTNENKKLKDEIDRLQNAISQLSQGNKVIMNSSSKNNNKEDENTATSEKITLSFLLNLFDGVLETPGRIVIMTTNFIDKLDKAFTRPGRIDICCKLGFANFQQIVEIVEHRYDTKLTDDQLQIIQNVGECITPAEIGRILFENFDNLEGAINGILEYSNNYMEKLLTKTKETYSHEEDLNLVAQDEEDSDISSGLSLPELYPQQSDYWKNISLKGFSGGDQSEFLNSQGFKQTGNLESFDGFGGGGGYAEF